MKTADRKPHPTPEKTDFLREIVAEDLESGRHHRVATRFPPEPNGYLHIGHAKSICLNFGVARENGGTCNLRFDDSNPLTEKAEYTESIQEDIRWLGFEWDGLCHASDYFEALYERAERLVTNGLAYVDSSSEEEIRELRGTVTEPGRPSRYRDRSVEENLDLLRRMRAGELPDGSHVLRAKIDLAAANMKMRDPLLYRIRHAHHYRTGDEWPIYPLYDFTHGLSDSIERITHSFCTLEFENNREIYDWLLEALDEPEPRPRQIEFARLNLSYTVLSKRRLLALVEEGKVDGWDDPRMPTLSGLRRRGVPPEAIRDFCDRIGVARADNVVDVALLEHSIRDTLNTEAPRVLCVLRPLELVIENYPPAGSAETEELDAPYFPHDVGKPGSRRLPFSRRLWIERDDFAEEPPKGFHRLAPGREVRLRYGYFVTCTGVDRDPATGEVSRVRCTYDPETRGGSAPDGRKPKGTIHWVSADHARDVEVRLYDRLFTVPRPGSGSEDFREHLNPESLVVLPGAKLEPAAADAGSAPEGGRFQFERQGYFSLDPTVSTPDRPVYNRIVTLRDTWSARQEEAKPAPPPTPGEPAARHQGPRDPREGLAGAALARFDRYAGELGLGPEEARALTDDPARAELFEASVADGGGDARAIANWVVHELPRAVQERPRREGEHPLDERSLDALPFGGRQIAELAALVEDGTLSSSLGREVLAEMVAGGGTAGEIVERRNLSQVSDEDELAAVIDRVFAEHPDEADRFRGGEAKLRGFFVGRVMQATGGKANPALVQELLGERTS
jgi:glutaminyl-tRNA synthetase